MSKNNLYPEILALILASVLILAIAPRDTKASGTIYIRADGSIDPPTAPISTLDNTTYSITDNVNESIVVERDNIVVNGMGFAVQGTAGVTGILLPGRSNVTISNIAVHGFSVGIMLSECHNVTLCESNITNTWCAIAIAASSYCAIWGNRVTDNMANGTVLYAGSSNNQIFGNFIANNFEAIRFFDASNYNVMTANTISNNSFGIFFQRREGYSPCLNNSVYHNDFLNNTQQVQVDEPASANYWDNGYPSGGNYWSDYNGTDSFRGSHQNETGADGIGDIPYLLDVNNTDNYPLMHTWSSLPVHNLNTGLAYATIQESINATETLDGHLILVDAGTYNENVTVHKAVFLSGTNKETTYINTTLGVKVMTDGITVTHFTITEGVTVLYGNNVDVEDNTIVTTYRGIELVYSNDSLVSGNNVYGLSDYCYGVMLRHCYSCRIQDNVLTNLTAGIGVERSENNTIFRNKIFGYSLLITDDYGLALAEASHNVFFENTVEQCQIGIGLFVAPTEENVFYHNNFLDYAQPADIWTGTGSNTLDAGYPFGGNYWSSYNGTDLYSGPSQNETGNDGIGDTPYVLDDDNIDHYPLVKFFIPGMHDLTAINMTTSKTGCKPMPTLGQNQELLINVTIENQGSYTEIFNATIYANATVIGNLEQRTLGSGDSKIFTFIWETSGFAYGNYTLETFVEPVSNETNTGNNVVLTWIIITIPGDLNGDFTVDIYDAIMLAGAYNSRPKSSTWNPNADINGDNIVDIYDAILLANHYNQHHP